MYAQQKPDGWADANAKQCADQKVPHGLKA
jgi:hypothetical protein